MPRQIKENIQGTDRSTSETYDREKLRKRFNMKSSFDYQVSACETFFVDDLPSDFQPMAEKERPDNTKQFKGPVFDITGFDAQQVVGLLSDIVNNEYNYKFTNGKTFYLLIQGNPQDELEELFRLIANRTPNQPGNGIVVLRPRGKKRFKQQVTKYDQLNGALKAGYDTDTKKFAADIKQLFKNNAQAQDDLPQATFEAYMILLFEIARRLVKVDNPTDKKQEYDILPIGSAIARFILLLELGDKKKSIFENVFLPGYRFHCFTGEPEDRRKAIDNINKAICYITKQQAMTKEDYLKELQEMFCSEERLAQMLFKKGEEEKLKSFMPRRRPNLSFSSDSESSSAYDYLDK